MPGFLTSWCISPQRLATVLLLVSVGTQAAEPVGNAPPVRGPQIMMYFQMPVGHAAIPAMLYGLRIEEARMQSGVPATALVDPPHRQQLLDLQLRPHADVRVEFARRVSWDFGRESFGAPSKFDTFAVRLPLDGRRPTELPALAAVAPATLAGTTLHR